MASKVIPVALFPLKHEFYRSLDNFIHKAGMLADAVDIALKNGAIDPKVAPVIKRQLEEFEAARQS